MVLQEFGTIFPPISCDNICKQRMQPRNKSLEGQSALKKGKMDIMFDFIRTEMNLQPELCLRFELDIAEPKTENSF